MRSTDRYPQLAPLNTCSVSARLRRRPHRFGQPSDERLRGFESRSHDLIAAAPVEPGLEQMHAGYGHALQPQVIEPWVVGLVAARSAFELRFGERHARGLGGRHGALEPPGPPPIVDRRAEALELVARG